jgi:hypothetical protein
MGELKEEMPSVFGKDSKKKELIKNLDKTYEKIQRLYNISPGDFPNISKMREHLELTVSFSFESFSSGRIL